MNRFHLCLLLTLFIFLAPKKGIAIRTTKLTNIPSYSSPTHQAFRPRPVKTSAPFSGQARDFEAQKRRVPTGSNPLHNKRWLLNFEDFWSTPLFRYFMIHIYIYIYKGHLPYFELFYFVYINMLYALATKCYF